MKFRKKPVVIDAIQYSKKNIDEINKFITDGSLRYDPLRDLMFIKTLEGGMYITKNDWIIKGINGEFYPCKPDIFKKTYEEEK